MVGIIGKFPYRSFELPVITCMPVGGIVYSGIEATPALGAG
jgi:hypothetical protein